MAKSEHWKTENELIFTYSQWRLFHQNLCSYPSWHLRAKGILFIYLLTYFLRVLSSLSTIPPNTK